MGAHGLLMLATYYHCE